MASAVLGVQSVWEPLNSSPFLFSPLSSFSSLSSPSNFVIFLSRRPSIRFPSSLPIYLSLSLALLLPSPPITYRHTSAAMCRVLWSSSFFNLRYKILFLNTQWELERGDRKEGREGRQIFAPAVVNIKAKISYLPWFATMLCDATLVPREKNNLIPGDYALYLRGKCERNGQLCNHRR